METLSIANGYKHVSNTRWYYNINGDSIMASWKKVNYRKDCLRTAFPQNKYIEKKNTYYQKPRKPVRQYWIERRLMSLVERGIIVPEINS